jgi:hypothetical protein
LNKEEIDYIFSHHPPSHPGIAAAHNDFREACKMMANVIETLVPDTDEKDEAIKRLQEVMFWEMQRLHDSKRLLSSNGC